MVDVHVDVALANSIRSLQVQAVVRVYDIPETQSHKEESSEQEYQEPNAVQPGGSIGAHSAQHRLGVDAVRTGAGQ